MFIYGRRLPEDFGTITEDQSKAADALGLPSDPKNWTLAVIAIFAQSVDGVNMGILQEDTAIKIGVHPRDVHRIFDLASAIMGVQGIQRETGEEIWGENKTDTLA